MHSSTISDHHACYFAHELTRHAAQGIDQLSASLFDAAVDLNPHQIEAALYFFRSPTVKGVLLADEVGLGKTIEASLILGQLWAEKKRRLLIICPASLRKQWSLELREKFNLPSFILDSRSYALDVKAGNPTPAARDAIVIVSYQYARKIEDQIRAIPWDVAVIDEAHKLRGCYRPKNRLGQSILRSLAGIRKVLLSATPLQNSLLELYGLSKLIDDDLFGDLATFRSRYAGKDADTDDLRLRLKVWSKRTLRSQVLEYIRYTERKPITVPFKPTEHEQKLYEAISAFLQRTDSYALPQRQRELTADVIRIRHAFLLTSIYVGLGLRSLDGHRLFDPLEKEVIWNRDRGVCQCPHCERNGAFIPFADATVHHIEEHSAGGQTVLKNGVLVCPRCHSDRYAMQRLTGHFRAYIDRILSKTSVGTPATQTGGEIRPSEDVQEAGLERPGRSTIKITIDWGALDVDREKETIAEPQASASVVKLLAALIDEFGTPMVEQLQEIPVVRFPLSEKPEEAFVNSQTGKPFSYLPVPGTNLYFCPQSASPEKVRRLNELFGRLVLPDDRVFPEGSVEVVLVES